MTQPTVAVTFDLPEEVDHLITSLAADVGCSREDLLVRATGVLKEFREARRKGYGHLGFAAHPSHLDVCVGDILARWR